MEESEQSDPASDANEARYLPLVQNHQQILNRHDTESGSDFDDEIVFSPQVEDVQSSPIRDVPFRNNDNFETRQSILIVDPHPSTVTDFYYVESENKLDMELRNTVLIGDPRLSSVTDVIEIESDNDIIKERQLSQNINPIEIDSINLVFPVTNQNENYIKDLQLNQRERHARCAEMRTRRVLNVNKSTNSNSKSQESQNNNVPVINLLNHDDVNVNA